ncbi:hypothetical protein DPMN_188759 [Dreissena polymorpha]|uniref:Uncharacterized protein n=1 Tax=Dreissena polymorpha TaxID=45954 RepID=A0A9D4DUC9_DREPO|nr:hypothetical protein DPMN_188759 [Dreissena polymorpha]
MGSSSSKFRKHLQTGDEVAALKVYNDHSDLRKGLDPNSSYGDNHQHETPLHLAARHGMKSLLRYSSGLFSIFVKNRFWACGQLTETLSILS